MKPDPLADVSGLGAGDPAAAGRRHAVYRHYVLGLLLATSISNYLDRQIINILVEPIKHDLHLSDGQLGMITGFSFAVFYSILGIPIARLADRANRPWIIAISVGVWSAFTVASGAARNFPQLFAARVGVGCGEGGATPPSHSLISELTTPENRSSALAILSLGSPIGAFLGLGLGGVIGEALGWRSALWIAALPGIVLAVLIALTVKEPRDGARSTLAAGPPPTLGAAFADLRSKPSFWWIAGAAACSAFVVYGQGAFYSSFFLLRHGRELAGFRSILGPLAMVGVALGTVRCLGGIAGTLTGGVLGDRGVVRGRKNYCTVPLISLTLGGPCCALVLLAPGVVPATLSLLVPSFLAATMFGPTYAAVQTIASPGTRATVAAVFLFITNIVGLGLGPVTVGWLSDLFQRTAPRADALEYALLAVCPVMWLGSLCFLMARRTIEDDLQST